MSQFHDEPHAGARPSIRRLPAAHAHLPANERIARAAARIVDDIDDVDGVRTTPSHDLRADQLRVFQDFASFLKNVSSTADLPFGRIILPPRTGKTVIAGHIISRSGLNATFIVPTKTLVEQTAREFRALLPNVPVGVYFGERKELVTHGVNITTYSILLRDHERGELPLPIASAALIFADEAHHVMTERRMDLLQQGFTSDAVRVALTATPDYDDGERLLCRFFPYLIHELTLDEALALSLLAPTRVWVAEVDAEGSRVRILAGDYEEATLGRIMSAAPFARAVQVFRYNKANAALSALIACTSRQQAYDLQAYLIKHRPKGSRRPEVILGETAPADRKRILDDFEKGRVDTIIQVGVLIEGWSSQRCKLLIDLAPTLSRVRATQKYFRAMTRDGQAEARIYVLLPSELPAMPILPMELFGRSCQEYECGQLIGPPDPSAGSRADVERIDQNPVAGVFLKRRILLSARIAAPKLDPQNLDDIRAVLASNGDLHAQAPCSLQKFREMNFGHPLFSGRGAFLLRWLGISQRVGAYAEFLSRMFPDGLAGQLLLGKDDREIDSSCYQDAQHLIDALPQQTNHTLDFADGWRALSGFDSLEPSSAIGPLTHLVLIEQRDEIAFLLGNLPRRHRNAVARRFGLLEQPEETTQEIAIVDDVCRARIGQIVKVAQRILERRCTRTGDSLEFRPFEQRFESTISYRLPAYTKIKAQFEHEKYSKWTSLRNTIQVRELLSRLQMLLDRVQVGVHLTHATPSFRSWLQAGAEWGESRWQDGDVVLVLRRVGHTYLRHEGDECTVYRLDAELSGLPDGTTLRLSGPLGRFEFFRTDGTDTEAVDDAWGELNDPVGYWDAKRRVRKPRKKRKRIRERREEHDIPMTINLSKLLDECARLQKWVERS